MGQVAEEKRDIGRGTALIKKEKKVLGEKRVLVWQSREKVLGRENV